MKYKIGELKDITDSREIMQSKPTGFSKYMMYIIIFILSAIILWSLIATKQISIKANGVVKPSEEITKISSAMNGKVTTNNISEGMRVKAGDVLLVLDGEEYELQKTALEESLANKEKDLEANKKLKNSILDGVNYLNSDDAVESNYSKMYNLYKENLKSGNAQIDALDSQKESIRKSISDLNLLLKSYREEKNYLDTSHYLYYQYSDYELTLNNYRKQITTYEEKIKELEESKIEVTEEEIKELEESKIEVTKEEIKELEESKIEVTEENKEQAEITNENIDKQVKEMKNSIESLNGEIEKYKNSAIMNATSNIAQYEAKLNEGVASSNNGSYKEQYITQLDNTISSLESAISELKTNLDLANNKTDATTIKAQYDGVITLINDIKVGDFIQAGTQVASIMPENNKRYEAEIYIENQNFAEINEGEDVVLEFVALPQREYGIVKTNIEKISVDAKVSEEEGKSYYTGMCNIPVTAMQNKKGSIIDIKNGMLVQARIINREVSYFRYFLEKINILDE